MPLGQCNQCCTARGVINCAVANIVARNGGAAAQMVPMCRIKHIFLGPFRAFQHADDILAHLARNVVIKAKRSGEVQRNRLKTLRFGRAHLLVQILASGGENLFRNAFLDPAVRCCLARACVLGLGQKLRSGPAAVDDVPAISRWRIVMDNQHSGCTLTRCFFVLIRPATVIGHRFAAKLASQILSVKIRVVDHHDNGFAFYIDTGIIIPALFRGDNAMADKDHLAHVHFGLRRFAIAADYIFAAIGKRDCFACFVRNA